MSSANIAVCVARESLKSARAVKGLVRALSAVPDFRMDRRRRHSLVTVLVIGVMCILSCGGSFRDMEACGRKFRQRLSGFLPMANGVPSHDTFCRVFSKLPPESLVQGLGVWLRAVAGRTDGQAVSFDGKAVRRAWQSRDVSWFENRLHWVLDVVFGEDYCRARSGFAPENLNAVRKLALTLLRRNGFPARA